MRLQCWVGSRLVTIETADAPRRVTTPGPVWARCLPAAPLRRPHTAPPLPDALGLLPHQPNGPLAIDNMICALFKRTFVPRYR